MRPLGILINRGAAEPLQRQLEAALRSAILRGMLPPGERIISSRELAHHLGLSRNTVLGALAGLYVEGFLESRERKGTFVAARLHGWAKSANSRSRKITPTPSSAPIAERRLDPAPGVAFRPGLPGLDLFPLASFRRAINAARMAASSLDYPDPLGEWPLRHAIASRIRQTRGVVCEPEQVIVTSGAQGAFSLICRAVLEKGETVIVEDPGYPSVRKTLASFGAKIVSARVDERGIDVRALRERSARLIYVTPSHQYPTGSILSLDRRLELLEWARIGDAMIVEDDYDSEFAYTGRPLPALQGLDREGRVLYVGTFSKVLAPSLRVGYVVVPDRIRNLFRTIQDAISVAPSALLQHALTGFMESGHLSRHITKMRKAYDERRRVISGLLASAAGASFAIRDSQAGLHFIAMLPRSIRDVDVAKRAADRGIFVPPLSGYCHQKPSLNGVIIGFAATPPKEAKAAVLALAASLKVH